MNGKQYKRAEARLARLKSRDDLMMTVAIKKLGQLRKIQTELEQLRRKRVANMKERCAIKEKLILSDSPCEVIKDPDT